MHNFIFVFIIAVCAIAQQDEYITVKKSDLPASTVKIIEAQQAAEIAVSGVKAVRTGVNSIGHEIGIAMDEGLGAISEHANKLADTKVGKFTMFLIAWKVMFNDIIAVKKEIMGVIIGLLMFFLGSGILIWSYRRTCMPSKIMTIKESTDDKGKVMRTKTIEDKEDFKVDDNIIGTRIMHLIASACLFVLSCIYVGGCGTTT